MHPSDAELSAYLDEMLVPRRAAEIERLLREHDELRQRTALLVRRRDQGGHTLGEIWRRRRLSCPGRTELGRYLLEVLDPGMADYIRFHVEVIGCRMCEANLADLSASDSAQGEERHARRRRYFESSAGSLRSRANP